MSVGDYHSQNYKIKIKNKNKNAKKKSSRKMFQIHFT